VPRGSKSGRLDAWPGQCHVGHIGERACDLVGAYRRAAEHLPEAVFGHDQNAGWHSRQCAKRRRLTSGRVPGEGYYANTRDDIVSALPKPIGTVLDVGCGSGGVAPGLRRAGATRLAGIEVVQGQAELARAHYDEVIAAPVEEALEQLDGPFDTILCLDVLEHLVDPEDVLRRLHGVAASDARLQVSLPNARHVSLLKDLVFRGTFGYTEWGHRDSTHLRWFTRRDIIEAMERNGWAVQRVSHPELGKSRQLDRLTRGRSTEFLVAQWYVLGARRPV
jgi:2-polyprenyl-3-methyl-5-hydroxy-6-metoxy-1,4-benzoquinol methylase